MANTAAPDSTRNLHTCTLLQEAAQWSGVLWERAGEEKGEHEAVMEELATLVKTISDHQNWFTDCIELKLKLC